MCWHVERLFTSSAAAAREARTFAGGSLGRAVTAAGDDFADDVELIVSELVTNSVQAGSATVIVTMELHRPALTVAVVDFAPGRPLVQNSAVMTPHGRGLLLVDSIARRWGVAKVSGGGDAKRVWADVALPGAAVLSVPCSR